MVSLQGGNTSQATVLPLLAVALLLWRRKLLQLIVQAQQASLKVLITCTPHTPTPHCRAQNRAPMTQYALWSTLGGLRGSVRRRGTLAPLEARITGAPGPQLPARLACVVAGPCPGSLCHRTAASVCASARPPAAHSSLCCPLPPAVGASSTVTRTTKRFGDFYRPLAPSNTPYLVRVAVPALNWTQSFNVTVPYTGRGALLNVIVP